MTPGNSGASTLSTLSLTTIALLAFAANSLLCRLALGQEMIDAASFTAVRVISGALMLSAMVLPRWRVQGRPAIDWRASAMLFAYMVFFSFSYLSLSAGTGALILFGAVQLTMFIVALRGGEAFPPVSWAGLLLAGLGLIYLVFPGVSAPDPLGAVLMAIAGIAWGFYSLLGKGATSPLEATANNFIYSVPLAIIASLLYLDTFSWTLTGLTLAIISGAITSGVGYAVWYTALRGLSATSAATVQLSVPVIAAFGGVVFLAEEVTLRLVLASIATLGGVAIVLVQRTKKTAALRIKPGE